MKSIISLLAGIALFFSGLAFAESEFDLKKDKNVAAGSELAAERFTNGNVISDVVATTFGVFTIVGVLLWADSANGTPETSGTNGTTASMSGPIATH